MISSLEENRVAFNYPQSFAKNGGGILYRPSFRNLRLHAKAGSPDIDRNGYHLRGVTMLTGSSNLPGAIEKPARKEQYTEEPRG